ncbi:MAG: hypothetical protein WA002_11735 [Candidatus Acidiferrales bacterium]
MSSEAPNHGSREAGFGASLRRNRGWLTFSIFAVVLLSTVGPVVARQLLNLDSGTEENEPANFIRRRAEWFFTPRASAHGHVPNDLRLKAIAERDEKIRREGTFASHLLHANVTISNTQWTPIGPQPLQDEAPFGNTSGRVNAVVVDPCDTTNDTVYIGAADGGVWRTTDGGNTWTPLTDGQPSLSSGSIALVPSGTNCNATSVYYGTGEENFAFDSLYGAGVLISSNSGSTWTPDSTFTVGQPESQGASAPYIGSLSVQPGHSNVLLAGLEGTSTITSGIWLSSDSGAHWTLHNPTTPSLDFGTGVAFDPNDSTGNTAFAAMGYPAPDSILVTDGLCTASPCNGVFKSTNGGSAWTRLTGLDTAINTALGANSDKNYGRITITLSSPLPGVTGNPANTVIFAAIADSATESSTFLAFAKSTNGGTTWSVLTKEPFCDRGSSSGQCFYDMALAIQPGNPLMLFAGGAAGAISGSSNPEPTLLRSTDGGTTWADISANNAGNSTYPQIHVDHHAIAFSPDGTKVYVGNDGGVWSSTDAMTATAGSQHWTDLNGGLQTMQFYPGMAPHPTNTNIIFGGTQDNGSQKYSGTTIWTDPGTCGDGGWTAIGPVSGGTFTAYLVCDDVGTGGTIWKSVNSGATFAATDSGINFNQSTNFIPPFVEDPTTPSNIYFGTSSLWQSKNSGSTWTAMAADANLTKKGSDYLTAFAVAPSDSNTIYTGSAQAAVNITTNGLNGSSATFTTAPTGDLPTRSVTQIAVDPTTSTTAYITFSGFSGFGDTTGHVFRTINGGTAWTSIDGDLPNVPVNDLVIDPGDPENTFYAATDIGVFVTTNAGGSWSTLAPGFPNDEVLSLKLQASNRLLLAGTHGRGAWEFALPAVVASPSITSLSPASVSAGSAQFTLTVNGANFSTNCTVNFNGTALATDTTGEPTTLTATVPASDVTAAGMFPITVTDSGTGKTSSPFNFAVTVPSISSISPASIGVGSAAFTLMVNGAGFSTNSIVNFNGTALATTTTGEPTSLTATVTAPLVASTGTFPVTVTDSGNTSNTVNFTVKPPVITTISPTSAVAGSAQFTLTVNGTAFTSFAFVNFNGSPLTTSDTGAPTSLTATVPATAIAAVGTVPVTVTEGGQTSNTVNFTVKPVAPVISSISPTSAVAGSAQFTLTVNGSNFSVNSIVDFNGSPLTTSTAGEPSSLTATVPATDIATAGSFPVTVTDSGQTSNSETFTVTAAPSPDFKFGTITSSPSNANVTAGNAVTYTVPVIAINEFSGSVALTCPTGLPAEASCELASATPTTPGMLVLSTTGNSIVPVVPGPRRNPLAPAATGVGLSAAMMFALFLFARPKTRPRRLALRFSLASAVLAFALVGCGGGSSSGSGLNGTPAGTYTVTVQGTSGSLMHSTTVTLIVSQ